MIFNMRGAGGKKSVLQSKTVTPGASDQVISADEGYDGLSQATISGSSNLVASNIKSGVNIFGVNGSHSFTYQSKSVTPGASSQTVYPSSGYTGLSSVSVSGSSNLTASNIKYGVSIFGVTGTYEHTTTTTYYGPTTLKGSLTASVACNSATLTGSATLYHATAASGTATTVTCTTGEISGNKSYSFSGGSGSGGSSISYTPQDYKFYVPGSGTSTSLTLTGSCTLPNGSYNGSVTAFGCTSSGISGCTSSAIPSCSYIAVSNGTATATVTLSYSIGGNTGGSGWKCSVSGGTMNFTMAFKVTSKAG